MKFRSEPTQLDLIPGLRRELILQAEVVATSDDPVEAFLERKGWPLRRIRELKGSIERKSIPNVFSGKPEDLSRSEIELQADIDAYLNQCQLEVSI